MPQALIQPDFVPANMIKVDVGNWVAVDWTGAIVWISKNSYKWEVSELLRFALFMKA